MSESNGFGQTEEVIASADAEVMDDVVVEAVREAIDVAEVAEVAEDEDPVAAFREQLRRAPGEWYVVHSYAGFENKVKTNLETRITSLNVEDYIFQVEVPMEELPTFIEEEIGIRVSHVARGPEAKDVSLTTPV